MGRAEARVGANTEGAAADPAGADETLDSICRGEVSVVQRRRGYRFAIDAVLLAAFCGRVRGRVVELGTGCGIIALLLAKRGAAEVKAVELQPGLAALARRNVQRNALDSRVEVIEADLRRLRGVLPVDHFDHVVSNPPYQPVASGHRNPDAEKALARHEVACELADVCRTARSLLRQGGTLRLVHVASRLAQIATALQAFGLAPRRFRLVHPKAGAPARLVLVEAIKGGSAVLEIEPPLVLHAPDGSLSEEARSIVG